MIKTNKKIITFISLIFLFAVFIIVFIVILNTNKNKDNSESYIDNSESYIDNSESYIDNSESYIDNSVYLTDETYSENGENIFLLNKISADENTVIVQLLNNGKTPICQYSITIQYEDSCMKLKDYDSNLSIYSPIVYPNKNDENSIIETPESGIINLEWASASNKSKEGEIITLVFDKTEKLKESTQMIVNVKSVSVLNGDEVQKLEPDFYSVTVKMD